MRLGGFAVALALLLGACGSDGDSDRGAPAPETEAPPSGVLSSVRDTLPTPPTDGAGLTVLLTHPGGVADPGLDAAVGALAQRPDLRVVVVVPGGAASQATTMSGFPALQSPGSVADAIAAALAGPAADADLVVVGIEARGGVGDDRRDAHAAVAHGVPALLVAVEGGVAPDHAAATMQLLEVLDLELDQLLGEPPAVHRLAVPSCQAGMLRGRLEVPPAPAPEPELRSDCTSTVRAPETEAEAFSSGWATLTRLP